MLLTINSYLLLHQNHCRSTHSSSIRWLPIPFFDKIYKIQLYWTFEININLNIKYWKPFKNKVNPSFEHSIYKYLSELVQLSPKLGEIEFAVGVYLQKMHNLCHFGISNIWRKFRGISYWRNIKFKFYKT